MIPQPFRAYTLADGTIPPADLPAAMQVWWGDHQGAPLGLMSQVFGIWPPESDPADQTLLGRATAAGSILVDERVRAATTSAGERLDLQAVSDAMLRADWHAVTVMLDDVAVDSGGLTLMGLDFVVGNVGTPFPFVMARPTGNPRPWPSLVTVTGFTQSAAAMIDEPFRVYALADGTIPPPDLPPVMQVWWGDRYGAPLGLMTDVHGPWPVEGDPAELTHRANATAASRILVDDRVWAATTRAGERLDLKGVAEAMLRAEWRPLAVMVDNDPVASAGVTIVGLEFVVGNIGTPRPFVLARPTGRHRPWPSLVTVPG